MGHCNKGLMLCVSKDAVEIVDLRKQVAELEEDIEFDAAVLKIASYRKKMFDAYIKEGFTEKQALSLCKELT